MKLMVRYVIIILILGLQSKFAYAFETKPAILYRSLWESVAKEAVSGQQIINEYNSYHQTVYSDCMTRMVDLPQGVCTNSQVTSNQPFGNSTISGYPSEYRQTLIRTTSIKNAQDASIKTTTQDGSGKIFSVTYFCPEGSAPRGTIDKLTCAYSEPVTNQCAVEGNPINYLTGDKIQKVTDYRGRGGVSIDRIYLNQRQGWAIEMAPKLFDFSGRYNNAQPQNNINYCLGFSVLRNLNRPNLETADANDFIEVPYRYCLGYVKQYDNTSSVILKTSDGLHHDFYNQGSYYASGLLPAHLFAVEPSLNNGVAWRLQYFHGGRESFDQHGFLKTIENNGNTISYTYQNDKLISKSNEQGDFVEYEYDEFERIKKIILPDESVVNYSYLTVSDSNLSVLSKITYPDNSTTTYLYENAKYPLALTGLIDGKNVRYATWEYDIKGRAVSSEHANGAEKWVFDYTGVDSGQRKISVTNPLGKETIYTFNVVGGKRLVTRVDGVQTSYCGAASKMNEYFNDGRLRLKTDWKGNTTTYSYNTFGQEISRTEAFGTPEARTITTEWHPDFYVKTRVVEGGKETLFSYDDNGRLLSTTTNPLPIR